MSRPAQDSCAEGRATVELYLLPTRRKGYRLFSSRYHHEHELEERRQAQEAESDPGEKRGFFRRLRGAYRGATRSRTAREKILREFRHPRRLEVYVAASLDKTEAESIYHALVEAQVRKHRRWLIVDGALLPVGVVLGLVPGPNVWLAYLAWRTLNHYRTKRGGEKALSEIETTFIPEPELDRLTRVMRKRFLLNRKARVREVGERLGIERLDRFY